MLKRIKIENLRGIREGEIDGLTRLVVLVGPNGSGKSTVLEGLFIGASRHPATAVGAVTLRRYQTWNGARWLLRGGDSSIEARTDVEWADGLRVIRRIRWDSVLGVPEARTELNKMGSPVPYTAFMIHRDEPPMAPLKDGSAAVADAIRRGSSWTLSSGLIVRLALWACEGERCRGVPDVHTLERVVSASIAQAYPDRAKAVQAWLDGRPAPPRSSAKEHSWS